MSLIIADPGTAAEIITEVDLVDKVVREDQLVRLVDNVIFMVDSSSSMHKPYKNTDKSTYQVMIDEFKARNNYLPPLGYKVGVYLYTPWKEIYPVGQYNRDAMAAALESLPAEPGGGTRLGRGLREMGDVLDTLDGLTALFVFTDGTYTGSLRPMDVARELAADHNVCFYVISSASDEINQRIVENLGSVNSCSRVIPVERFVDNPQYQTGALFAVRSTEKVVTTADQRIVGLDVEDLTFEFDEADLQPTDMPELQAATEFLKEHPQSWVVLRGYADNIGTEEVNNRLSRRRVETVAQYLMDAGVAQSRIVVHWHGSANPIASNDTPEGRAANRRVEMAIGMSEMVSAN